MNWPQSFRLEDNYADTAAVLHSATVEDKSFCRRQDGQAKGRQRSGMHVSDKKWVCNGLDDMHPAKKNQTLV